MASVKISGLNPSSNLNVNPAHSIFPTTDTDTGDTTKISAKDLGDTLYSNNQLIVGSGGYVLPNLVAQFTGVGPSYVQVNAQNLNANGTCDWVTTADIGSDVNYYIDLGITNSNYSNTSPYNSLGTLIEPLSGYLYVQGNYGTGLSGNLVIGTTGVGTETRLFAGGVNSDNVISKITTQGFEMVDGKWIKFGDGTYQTTAAAPNNYTRSAYSFANNVNVYAYSAYAFANTVNTSVYTANTFLQANDSLTLANAKSYTDTANSFLQSNDALTFANAKSYTDVANNYIQSRYLANTTGTFGGSLNITGNANVGSLLSVSNTTYDYTNTALVKIVGSSGYIPPGGAGYMLHIVGVDGVPCRVISGAHGANTFAIFGGRKSNGTAASPTAAANNDVIARFGGSGHTGTGYVQGGQSRIDFIATEDYTTANNGSKIEFWNTREKTNTLVKIATFNADSASFTGVVNPLKGFIYTPNTVSSNVTSVTIDMANNAMYKISCNSPITITPSGFTAGKVTEVWLTHYGNNNDAITHGCSALNSTKGSTSFNVNVPTLVYLRYFSVDGDLANTYVSINYG